MKKTRHPVDEFFSKSLKNYKVTPTEAAKNAFLKEAEGIDMTLPAYTSRKKLVYLILSGIMLLTCLTGIITHNWRDKRNTTVVLKNKTLSDSKNNHATTGKLSASKGSVPSHKSYSLNVQSIPKVLLTRRQESFNISTPAQSQIKNSSASSSTYPGSGNDLFLRNTIRRMDPVYLAQISNTISFLFPLSEMTELDLNNIHDHSDTIKSNKVQTPFHKDDESSMLKNRVLSAGIYYSPEWMFNILEANKNMRADNLGLEGTFHFGPYSVGTGIGISISKGTNEILIGYNDYKGTYKGLDSIVFKWDESHTHLVPVYYYTNKVVYDTLLKLDYSYYEKRYIYLQIPIKLGYDLIRTKIFTLGIRVGPTLSILLQTRTKNASYDLGKDRIVQLNNVTPDRVQTNWQIGAGINAGISLTRMFGLEIEPDVRYYFNSVYEKPDNDKKPWSVGFRVAFLIRK